ncbi:hypothetical protein AVO45_15815 [Ruegeria marisrubri]|uniref:Zinc-binding protein n=1 Tax=Ruegeria marisrubri TaxID=1685379 RepID=A0A0X3TBP5_9RHOB|nr:DUF2796 domain-containing protein [Ruegeria marisrubri]KUJ73202.1 hypothetical protein AVO45_15815 [Ruegeria marisrubri]
MKHLVLALSVFPAALSAEQTRSLDAHMHGAGTLGIAFSGTEFSLSLEAPGADIVGFEHAALSAEDRDLVQAAISDLAKPLSLFVVPNEAGCTVKSANVALAMAQIGKHEAGGDHSDEATEGHAHSEDQETRHSEFHAEYLITCQNIDAIDSIRFDYFERFPNSQELDVQVVSPKGARAYEVERSAADLDLRGMF